jgi:hypothetical protein
MLVATFWPLAPRRTGLPETADSAPPTDGYFKTAFIGIIVRSHYATIRRIHP